LESGQGYEHAQQAYIVTTETSVAFPPAPNTQLNSASKGQSVKQNSSRGLMQQVQQKESK